MNGIICVNKPSEWTSFDVVAKVRGMAKTRKVGHAGTLDPMATGVLPLFFGNATKACDVMPNDNKGYLALCQFGFTTNTLDITGEIQSRAESHLTREEVEKTLSHFRGDIWQTPPMFSAIQVNGRRLYDIARGGGEVERPKRQVTIYKLELLDFDEERQCAKLEVLCSKGTYIRSLCSDIGDMLQVGATLIQLQRHIAGEFTLSDCYTLEELQTLTDQERLEQAVLPIERVFEQLPKIKLNAVQSKKFKNGVKLDLRRLIYQDKDGFQTVYDNENHFMGLASLNREKMELKIEKMFVR